MSFCYLSLLHVTQLFLLFVPVICYMNIPVIDIPLIDSYYLHDTHTLSLSLSTVALTTWRMFSVDLLLVLVTRRVMGTYQTMCTYTPL